MNNPYQALPSRSFWKKSISNGWDPNSLLSEQKLIKRGERVASAGSCFAANIIPYLEKAGFDYVRTEQLPPIFGFEMQDNFSYSKFSAAYGNIYTARQAVQLVKRALGRFTPKECKWFIEDDLIVDPFRPGMKHQASSELEFDMLTQAHLNAVLEALKFADVFVFTLGLTEAWMSSNDGAVFPVCPGTIAGIFNPDLHVFHNFSVQEVSHDLDLLINLIREINPKIRFILTVSPVPLVATATRAHVLPATIYSKSVLRAAAGEAEQRHSCVTYFPAYEIVSGPQAPESFYEADRREPSTAAINTVMEALLKSCEINTTTSSLDADFIQDSGLRSNNSAAVATPSQVDEGNFSVRLSRIIAQAECEEAALDFHSEDNTLSKK